MKLLRVNMNTLTTAYEDLPEQWKLIGGRGLCAKIMTAEVAPDVDPLGADAKLIFATGPMAGTKASSCGRMSVGGKSPLTLGIKEANVGGPTGQKLDRLGIRAVIVEGKPADDSYYCLYISRDDVSIQNADDFLGKKIYDMVEDLKLKYDPSVAVASIGIAGERRWKGAGIGFTDKNGHNSRCAARGGLGAVMGAKGLKTIVIDDRNTGSVEIKNRELFREALKNWKKVVTEDPMTAGLKVMGTPMSITGLRSIGSMPALNYGSDPLEGVDKISGEAIQELNASRGGKTDMCMPGCAVGCSIVFKDAEGNHLTSSYEYETIALMGTNLGIVDPDIVARFDRICDELGVDTMELGSAMGVAASAGKMTFGDIASAEKLLDELEQGTDFGSVLGNGVVATCRHLGIERIPAFGGQAMPAHDPRASKATGVSYATSPQGGDHTAGYDYSDPFSPEGQVERSLKTQIIFALADTLGYCILAIPFEKTQVLPFLKDMLNSRFGLEMSIEELVNIGRETLRDELAFNKGTEFSTAHSKPDFLTTETLAPMGQVFDVDPAAIEKIWEQLDSLKVEGAG